MSSGIFYPAAIGDDTMIRAAASWWNQYCGFGNYSNNTQSGSFRFVNVTIDQGATINSAFIRLKSARSDSSNVVTKVYANDVDDAVAPTSYAEFTGLALTTAYADWTPANWTLDGTYDSASLVAVLQEIVDRGTFASGNDVQFIVQDNGSTAGAERYPYDYGDAGGANKAELHVTWGLTPTGVPVKMHHYQNNLGR